MSELSEAWGAAYVPGRIRRRWDPWAADLRHRYRTLPQVRRTMFIQSVAVLTALVVIVLGCRSLATGELTPLDCAVALGLVALVRAAALRPQSPPHAHGIDALPEPASCPDAPANRSINVLVVRWVAGLAAIALAAGLPVAVAGALLAVVAVTAGAVMADKIALGRARRTLRRVLAQRGTRFALVYAGQGGGPTHVGMWQPYLDAASDPWVLFNVRPTYCAELRAGLIEASGSHPTWVQLGSDPLADLKVVTTPVMTTYFYVHNAPAHLRTLHVEGVRKVWLGHGDSDKTGSYHERHRLYDVLVVSGQAAIDRYARHGVEIGPERFVIIGRPQAGDVEVATTPITEIARPRVLYAPTWRGNGQVPDFSSIDWGLDIVRAIVAVGADVIFRPHPVFLRTADRRALLAPVWEFLRADTEDPATPGNHMWGSVPDEEWTVVDCMNHADVLVSDVSSVVSDWLASAKPYAMINTLVTPEEFGTEIPISAGGHVITIGAHPSAPTAEEVLRTIVRHDSQAQERIDMRRYVLGGFTGEQSGREFEALVHRFAHEPLGSTPPHRGVGGS